MHTHYKYTVIQFTHKTACRLYTCNVYGSGSPGKRYNFLKLVKEQELVGTFPPSLPPLLLLIFLTLACIYKTSKHTVWSIGINDTLYRV